MKLMKMIGAVTVLATSAMITTSALAEKPDKGRGSGPIIYVESQGLFFDSIVLANLPQKGRFQQLKTDTGPTRATLATSAAAGGLTLTATATRTRATCSSCAPCSDRDAWTPDRRMTQPAPSALPPIARGTRPTVPD